MLGAGEDRGNHLVVNPPIPYRSSCLVLGWVGGGRIFWGPGRAERVPFLGTNLRRGGEATLAYGSEWSVHEPA
jgi:hypothetical protein